MPLAQPVPDLMALDLLVSVGELGSISAAADAHRITQPAASMRLRSLEQALGLRLLVRSHAGSRLTDEGRATAEWAAAVIREVRTLLTGTAALRSGGRRHLRLAASLTVAEYLLPDWLGQLAVVAPGVSVSLEMGNTARVSELVTSGRAELGFIEGDRVPGRTRARDLVVDELVVVVGRDHPWRRRRRPVDASALAGTPILMREPGSGTRDVLVAEMAGLGLEPTVLMELGSTTAIKAAAISGRAPAVLSRLAVAADLRSGELVEVPLEGIRLRRVIRAIWTPARAPTGAASRLLSIAATST